MVNTGRYDKQQMNTACFFYPQCIEHVHIYSHFMQKIQIKTTRWS